MIGLSIIFGLICYVLLARFIMKLIFNRTDRLLYKRLAIVFFVFLPIWDVIIGYPIFWYLDKFHSGIEVYETVDDVEGYYVGEKLSRWSPLMPLDGFQFVDYTLKYSDKYFRSKWVDNNTSASCYQPTEKRTHLRYKEIFKSGRCIAVSQISKNDRSQYEVITAGDYRIQVIPFLKIEKIVSPIIMDRQRNKNLAKFIFFRWDQGFLSNILAIGRPNWIYTQDADLFEISNYFVTDASPLINKTLKIR